MSTPPSRNAPCPCGSGRKYKSCCLPRARFGGGGGGSGHPGGPPRSVGPLEPHLAAAAASGPWEVDVVPFPTVIGDHPGRRVSAVLVVAGGLVLDQDLLTAPLGRAEEVVDTMEEGVRRAVARTDVEPTVVRVRHRGLAPALGLRLAPLGARVEGVARLPALSEAARALRGELLGEEAVAAVSSSPTWAGWGLSHRHCRALFAAAARYRRARPWLVLDDDPITVRSPFGTWTAAVLGAAGETTGLALYTTADDYADAAASASDEDAAETFDWLEGPMLSLTFVPRGELTREMQREVASAGWEVADPEGYPVVFAAATPGSGLPPEAVDALMAVLWAVPDLADDLARGLVEGHLPGERIRWEHPTLDVVMVWDVPGGFAWPVPDRLEPAGPEGPGARPGAFLPPTDAPSAPLPDGAVVEAFQAHLSASVSEATARRHARAAEELVLFLNGRQAVPLAAMTELDLRTFLYDAFPRLRPGYTRTESFPGSLRRFLAFVEERHGVRYPWAAALLDDKDSLHRRVAAAPVGGWWDDAVMAFRGDVWQDLERRVLLLPDDWVGALEVEALSGVAESRLRTEAQRLWLAWRDEEIRGGTDDASRLEDALSARLLTWLDAPHPADPEGRTRLAVIRAERTTLPREDRDAMMRAFFGEGARDPDDEPMN